MYIVIIKKISQQACFCSLVFPISVEKYSVIPDQMASSGASCSGSLVFSN